MTRFSLSLLCLVLVGVVSADEKLADEKPIVPEAVTLDRPVNFAKDVQPILDNNCVACHNEAIAENRLSLEDVPSLLKGGKSGASIVPGSAEKSLLYIVAARMPSKIDAMPPLPNDVASEALTPRELGLLKLWIEQGAKESTPAGKTVIAWQPLADSLNAVYAMALSSDESLLAVGRANRITLYDRHSGQPLADLVDPELTSQAVPGSASEVAHRDLVQSLAFHPSGSLLASGGFRNIKLWERDPNTTLRSTKLPESTWPEKTPRPSALSADQKRLAVLMPSGSVAVLDVDANKIVGTIKTQPDVTGLAFLTADRLLTGGADKTVRLWNVADGKELAKLELAAPVTALMLNRERTAIVAAHTDNIIRTYNIPTGEGEPDPKPIKELKGHGAKIEILTPYGTGGDQLLSGDASGSVRRWDIPAQRNVRSFGLGVRVTGIAVSPDAKQLVTVGENGTGKLWDINNGRELKAFKLDGPQQRDIARLTDETKVAAGLVNIAKNNITAAEKLVKDREEGLKAAKERKTAAEKAVPEAEKKLVEAKKKREQTAAARKPDPKNGKLKREDEEAEKGVLEAEAAVKRAKTALMASTNAITRSEGSLEAAKRKLARAKKIQQQREADKKEWDAALDTAKKNTAPGAATGVDYFAAGKLIGVTDATGTLHLYESGTMQPTRTVVVPQGNAGLYALSDLAALTVTNGDQVTVSTLAPQWKLAAVLGPASKTSLDLEGSPFVDRVLTLDFSRDGKLLAAGGGEPSRSGEIVLFDVESRSVKKVFEEPHSDTVLSVEFDWQGNRLVSAAADKFVKLWNIETGELIRSYEGHTNHVLDASISADGSVIASGGADNAIKLWTTDTGEQKRTLSNHSKQVTSLEFIGTTADIVSSSGDKTVRFFRTSNGQNYRSFSGSPDYVYAATATGDTKTVIGAGEDGTVRIWDGSNSRLLLQLKPTE